MSNIKQYVITSTNRYGIGGTMLINAQSRKDVLKYILFNYHGKYNNLFIHIDDVEDYLKWFCTQYNNCIFNECIHETNKNSNDVNISNITKNHIYCSGKIKSFCDIESDNDNHCHDNKYASGSESNTEVDNMENINNNIDKQDNAKDYINDID